MENSVKQRLTKFATFKNLSISKFESQCGLGNGYIGKLKGEPGCRKLDDILRVFPELNREWLLYGEGEMLKTQHANSGNITITGNGNSHIGHGQTVIEVKDNGIEVECPKCGEVIEVPDTAVIPLIPAEVAKLPDLNLEKWRHNYPQEMQEVDLRQIWGNGVFLMRVDTRAMEPEYREGAFLVLRKIPDISYARADGSAYVVDTMRPHTLFRYLSKERDGSYTLTAENDRRGPIYLKSDDILNVYDIVGSFRIGR